MRNGFISIYFSSFITPLLQSTGVIISALRDIQRRGYAIMLGYDTKGRLG